MDPVGRGSDQAIGHVIGQLHSVHAGGDAHRTDGRGTADDDFVKRVPVPERFARPPMLGADHHTVFDPVFTYQQLLQGGVPLLASKLHEKAQPAHVDTQDGHITGAHRWLTRSMVPSPPTATNRSNSPSLRRFLKEISFKVPWADSRPCAWKNALTAAASVPASGMLGCAVTITRQGMGKGSSISILYRRGDPAGCAATITPISGYKLRETRSAGSAGHLHASVGLRCGVHPYVFQPASPVMHSPNPKCSQPRNRGRGSG